MSFPINLPSTSPIPTDSPRKKKRRSAASTVARTTKKRSSLSDTLTEKYASYLQQAALEGGGYKCMECDLLLKCRKNWMEHMKSVHFNHRFACRQCGEVFKWRSTRQRHMLSCNQTLDGPPPTNIVPDRYWYLNGVSLASHAQIRCCMFFCPLFLFSSLFISF